MSKDKLYDNKRITAIIISVLIGISIPLILTYKKKGYLSIVEISVAIVVIFLIGTITFFIVRHANKEE